MLDLQYKAKPIVRIPQHKSGSLFLTTGRQPGAVHRANFGSLQPSITNCANEAANRAQPGMASNRGAGSPGLAWPAWPGQAMPSQAWPGLAWPGLARPGLAWPRLARPGLAWPGLAWPGLAWPGLAWSCLAWPDLAGQ